MVSRLEMQHILYFLSMTLTIRGSQIINTEDGIAPVFSSNMSQMEQLKAKFESMPPVDKLHLTFAHYVAMKESLVNSEIVKLCDETEAVVLNYGADMSSIIMLLACDLEFAKEGDDRSDNIRQFLAIFSETLNVIYLIYANTCVEHLFTLNVNDFSVWICNLHYHLFVALSDVLITRDSDDSGISDLQALAEDINMALTTFLGTPKVVLPINRSVIDAFLFGEGGRSANFFRLESDRIESALIEKLNKPRTPRFLKGKRARGDYQDKCLLSEQFVLANDVLEMGFTLLDACRVPLGAVKDDFAGSMEHYFDNLGFVVDNFGKAFSGYLSLYKFRNGEIEKEDLVRRLLSAIVWDGDRIVYPDVDTIDLWSTRISKTPQNWYRMNIADIFRIPAPDASLEMVMKAMSPVFFSPDTFVCAADMHTDPYFMGHTTEHPAACGMYNPETDSNYLHNIPQILDFMSNFFTSIFPFGFWEKARLVHFDTLSIYNEIFLYPAIDSVTDTRSLLALWNGDNTRFPNDLYLELGSALAVGSFGQVYPPERLRFLRECIIRGFEPWEKYTNIVTHAWSAILIRSKYRAKTLAVDAPSIFSFMQFMYAIKNIRRKLKSCGDRLMCSEFAIDEPDMSGLDVKIKRNIEEMARRYPVVDYDSPIDGSSILLNLPVKEFDRACVCRLLLDLTTTPCPPVVYANYNLEDFKDTAIIHFFFHETSIWFNVQTLEWTEVEAFLKMFHSLNLAQIITDTLQKGLRLDILGSLGSQLAKYVQVVPKQ